MHPQNDIALIRKVALYLGLVAIALAAAMSFSFGWQMSWKHAALLALLTFAGSLIFPYAGHLRNAGRKSAMAYMLIGGLFLGTEYFSHVGYGVGQRVMNTEQTGVQNANYEIAQKSLESERSLTEAFKRQLADLKAQNAWATTVSADGLRAQLAPMDEAIRQEERRGGCGPKCLALQEKKAAIEDKIAIAEKVDDLTKRIEATQRVIDKKEAVATTTEFKSSPVVAQTRFVSQLATFELDPDEGALTWTQIGIGALLALVTTFLAPVLFSIAWGPADMVPGHRARTIAATDKAADGEVSLLRAKLAEMQSALQRAPEPRAEHIHLHEADKLGELNGTLAALKRLAAQPQLRAA